MKNNILILIFLSGIFFGCAKEDLVAPSAEYDIQTLDKVKNEYVNMEKPYVLKVNVAYRVISHNSSEYNSFYMGDTIKVGKRLVKHIYSTSPNSDYQGVPVPYDPILKKSILPITYTAAGVYPITFVACEVGDNGNDVAYTVNSENQITVIE